MTRTPHIAIHADLPVAPGSASDIEVFVDQEAAGADEESTSLVVPAGTSADVYLMTSDYFVIDGPAVKSMVIDK